MWLMKGDITPAFSFLPHVLYHLGGCHYSTIEGTIFVGHMLSLGLEDNNGIYQSLVINKGTGLSVLQLIKHVVLENTIASLNIEILKGQMQLISQNKQGKG